MSQPKTCDRELTTKLLQHISRAEAAPALQHHHAAETAAAAAAPAAAAASPEATASAPKRACPFGRGTKPSRPEQNLHARRAKV